MYIEEVDVVVTPLQETDNITTPLSNEALDKIAEEIAKDIIDAILRFQVQK